MYLNYRTGVESKIKDRVGKEADNIEAKEIKTQTDDTK